MALQAGAQRETSFPSPKPPSSPIPMSSTTSQSPPPECTFRAQLTVFGAFLALFCTFGQFNAFGTFQTWYAAHQLHHLSPSTIAWIGSLQLWVFFFSGGFIGRVFDAFGPFWLLTTGSVILVASIILTSVATQYYQLILAQGILFGLGVGLLFYPSLISVSTHFNKYRATALGLAAAGSSAGGVVYPIMLQQLFKSVGFGWAVRISALLSALCCITAILTISCGPSYNPCKSSDPSKVIGMWASARIAFSDIRFTLLAIGSCIAALGLFIPYFYILDFVNATSPELALSPTTAFYLIAALNAGGIPGRIAPAYLADVIGRFNLLVPAAFFSGVAVLSMWLVQKVPALIIAFAVLYGFSSGAFVALINPCVAQISEKGCVGSRIGLLYTVIAFPSLIGNPAAGALLSRQHGSFTGLVAFSGSTVIVGSLVILAARFAVDKRICTRV
ncbi:MFS general substrate transporter [Pluteus cervinus]|uniref:MFS general substrate transporter n=1 Tax=Pluteus cervinus TaxID=181527 RepID=A0ACD3ASY1_9AGAR|nr:MFS general substrate transporter [Pluteus cervinus]